MLIEKLQELIFLGRGGLGPLDKIGQRGRSMIPPELLIGTREFLIFGKHLIGGEGGWGRKRAHDASDEVQM
jgi:hypothetical protein